VPSFRLHVSVALYRIQMAVESSIDVRTIKEGLTFPPTFSSSTQQILNGLGEASSGCQTLRNAVDKRIRELEDEIRTLKTFRNASAGTAALPTEILSLIFLECTKVPAFTCPLNAPDRPTWLAITQVCRKWRAVALNCPSLWSRVLFDCSPQFTDLMVERSREVPLNVWLHPYIKQISYERIAKVFSQHRLHSLTWTKSTIGLNRLCFDSGRNILSAILDQTALESVILDDRTFYSPLDPRIVIPEAAFSGALALERLEIKNCQISSWKFIPPSSRLGILKLRNSSSFRPTLEEFLDTLSSTSRLEELELQWILPLKESRPSHAPLISLPSVQSLTLYGTADEVAQFLQFTSIPNARTLDFQVQSINVLTAPADLQPFFTALKPWIDAHSGMESGGMSGSRVLTNLHVTNLPSTIKCTFGHPTDTPVSSPPTVLKISAPSVVTSVLLSTFTTYFDISQLCSLQCLDFDIDKDIWVNTFSHLWQLASIELINSSVETFIACLAQDPTLHKTSARGDKREGYGQPSSEKPFFPALRKIRLKRANFDEDLLRNGACVERFCDVLDRRPITNPVEQVEIDESYNFTESDMEKLKTVVQSLQWDGSVDMRDEEDEEEEEDYSDEYAYSGGCHCIFCSAGL